MLIDPSTLFSADLGLSPTISRVIGTASAGHKFALLSSTSEREVSFSLGVGVLVVPYIFAWLLILPGDSKEARALGFTWLALILLTMLT